MTAEPILSITDTAGQSTQPSSAENNAMQIATLARALHMQRGFGLYFVSIRQADQRRLLLADLRNRLPGFSIQEVFLREPETHLLGHLQRTLTDFSENDLRPLLCVYGVENWLGGVEDVKYSAFVADLNATRNAFPSGLDCPLLFCVPEHILVGINRGAPDFFSVRSGVYFLDTPVEPRIPPTLDALRYTELQAALGTGVEQRQQQTAEWEELLNGYRALPPDKRDPLAEIRALDNLSTMHHANGDYDLAAQLLESALSIGEQVFGDSHLEIAEILNSLGLVYQRAGKYSQALSLLSRALSINESIDASDDSIARNLNNAATVYESMGDYSRALSFYERILAIRESSSGSEHIHTAESLNNLAVLYARTGEYGRSIPPLQRSLAITEKLLGSEHPDTATCISNLAAVYDDIGEYSRARPLYKEVLRVRESVLGPDHPDTAFILNNLGLHYEVTGEYARALPLLERALSIRENVLGHQHPETADSLANLAQLYDRMGELRRAIPLFEKVLAIREATLGAEHPDTAISLSNLASSYTHIDQYERALPLLERAIKIGNHKLGVDHPTTRIFEENLSIVKERMRIRQQQLEPAKSGRRDWPSSLFDVSGNPRKPKKKSKSSSNKKN